MEFTVNRKMKEIYVIFPWVKKVRKKLLKSFCEENTDVQLLLQHHLHEEFEKLLYDKDTMRIESFYGVISYFYLHFCWKVNWNKDYPMKFFCVQLLYYIVFVGLVLIDGDVKSHWMDPVLTALKSFPGGAYLMYDALLLIQSMKKKYHKVYALILKHILCNDIIKSPSDSESFMKILLLFRRMKCFSKGHKEESTISSVASKVKCPPDFMNWISLNIGGFSDLSCENVAIEFLNRNLKLRKKKKIFQVLFSNKYDEKFMNPIKFQKDSDTIELLDKKVETSKVDEQNLKIPGAKSVKCKTSVQFGKTALKTGYFNTTVCKEIDDKVKQVLPSTKCNNKSSIIILGGESMDTKDEHLLKPTENQSDSNEKDKDLEAGSINFSHSTPKSVHTKKRIRSQSTTSIAPFLEDAPSVSPPQKKRKFKRSGIISSLSKAQGINDNKIDISNSVSSCVNYCNGASHFSSFHNASKDKLCGEDSGISTTLASDLEEQNSSKVSYNEVNQVCNINIKHPLILSSLPVSLHDKESTCAINDTIKFAKSDGTEKNATVSLYNTISGDKVSCIFQNVSFKESDESSIKCPSGEIPMNVNHNSPIMVCRSNAENDTKNKKHENFSQVTQVNDTDASVIKDNSYCNMKESTSAYESSFRSNLVSLQKTSCQSIYSSPERLKLDNELCSPSDSLVNRRLKLSEAVHASESTISNLSDEKNFIVKKITNKSAVSPQPDSSFENVSFSYSTKKQKSKNSKKSKELIISIDNVPLDEQIIPKMQKVDNDKHVTALETFHSTSDINTQQKSPSQSVKSSNAITTKLLSTEKKLSSSINSTKRKKIKKQRKSREIILESDNESSDQNHTNNSIKTSLDVLNTNNVCDTSLNLQLKRSLNSDVDIPQECFDESHLKKMHSESFRSFGHSNSGILKSSSLSESALNCSKLASHLSFKSAKILKSRKLQKSREFIMLSDIYSSRDLNNLQDNFEKNPKNSHTENDLLKLQSEVINNYVPLEKKCKNLVSCIEKIPFNTQSESSNLIHSDLGRLTPSQSLFTKNNLNVSKLQKSHKVISEFDSDSCHDLNGSSNKIQRPLVNSDAEDNMNDSFIKVQSKSIMLSTKHSEVNDNDIISENYKDESFQSQSLVHTNFGDSQSPREIIVVSPSMETSSIDSGGKSSKKQNSLKLFCELESNLLNDMKPTQNKTQNASNVSDDKSNCNFSTFETQSSSCYLDKTNHFKKIKEKCASFLSGSNNCSSQINGISTNGFEKVSDSSEVNGGESDSNGVEVNSCDSDSDFHSVSTSDCYTDYLDESSLNTDFLDKEVSASNECFKMQSYSDNQQPLCALSDRKPRSISKKKTQSEIQKGLRIKLVTSEKYLPKEHSLDSDAEYHETKEKFARLSSSQNKNKNSMNDSNFGYVSKSSTLKIQSKPHQIGHLKKRKIIRKKLPKTPEYISESDSDVSDTNRILPNKELEKRDESSGQEIKESCETSTLKKPNPYILDPEFHSVSLSDSDKDLDESCLITNSKSLEEEVSTSNESSDIQTYFSNLQNPPALSPESKQVSHQNPSKIQRGQENNLITSENCLPEGHSLDSNCNTHENEVEFERSSSYTDPNKKQSSSRVRKKVKGYISDSETDLLYDRNYSENNPHNPVNYFNSKCNSKPNLELQSKIALSSETDHLKEKGCTRKKPPKVPDNVSESDSDCSNTNKIIITKTKLEERDRSTVKEIEIPCIASTLEKSNHHNSDSEFHSVATSDCEYEYFKKHPMSNTRQNTKEPYINSNSTSLTKESSVNTVIRSTTEVAPLKINEKPMTNADMECIIEKSSLNASNVSDSDARINSSYSICLELTRNLKWRQKSSPLESESDSDFYQFTDSNANKNIKHLIEKSPLNTKAVTKSDDKIYPSLILKNNLNFICHDKTKHFKEKQNPLISESDCHSSQSNKLLTAKESEKVSESKRLEASVREIQKEKINCSLDKSGHSIRSRLRSASRVHQSDSILSQNNEIQIKNGIDKLSCSDNMDVSLEEKNMSTATEIKKSLETSSSKKSNYKKRPTLFVSEPYSDSSKTKKIVTKNKLKENSSLNNTEINKCEKRNGTGIKTDNKLCKTPLSEKPNYNLSKSNYSKKRPISLVFDSDCNSSLSLSEKKYEKVIHSNSMESNKLENMNESNIKDVKNIHETSSNKKSNHKKKHDVRVSESDSDTSQTNEIVAKNRLRKSNGSNCMEIGELSKRNETSTKKNKSPKTSLSNKPNCNLDKSDYPEKKRHASIVSDSDSDPYQINEILSENRLKKVINCDGLEINELEKINGSNVSKDEISKTPSKHTSRKVSKTPSKHTSKKPVYKKKPPLLLSESDCNSSQSDEILSEKRLQNPSDSNSIVISRHQQTNRLHIKDVKKLCVTSSFGKSNCGINKFGCYKKRSMILISESDSDSTQTKEILTNNRFEEISDSNTLQCEKINLSDVTKFKRLHKIFSSKKPNCCEGKSNHFSKKQQRLIQNETGSYSDSSETPSEKELQKISGSKDMRINKLEKFNENKPVNECITSSKKVLLLEECLSNKSDIIQNLPNRNIKKNISTLKPSSEMKDTDAEKLVNINLKCNYSLDNTSFISENALNDVSFSENLTERFSNKSGNQAYKQKLSAVNVVSITLPETQPLSELNTDSNNHLHFELNKHLRLELDNYLQSDSNDSSPCSEMVNVSYKYVSPNHTCCDKSQSPVLNEKNSAALSCNSLPISAEEKTRNSTEKMLESSCNLKKNRTEYCDEFKNKLNEKFKQLIPNFSLTLQSKQKSDSYNCMSNEDLTQNLTQSVINQPLCGLDEDLHEKKKQRKQVSPKKNITKSLKNNWIYWSKTSALLQIRKNYRYPIINCSYLQNKPGVFLCKGECFREIKNRFDVHLPKELLLKLKISPYPIVDLGKKCDQNSTKTNQSTQQKHLKDKRNSFLLQPCGSSDKFNKYKLGKKNNMRSTNSKLLEKTTFFKKRKELLCFLEKKVHNMMCQPNKSFASYSRKPFWNHLVDEDATKTTTTHKDTTSRSIPSTKGYNLRRERKRVTCCNLTF